MYRPFDKWLATSNAIRLLRALTVKRIHTTCRLQQSSQAATTSKLQPIAVELSKDLEQLLTTWSEARRSRAVPIRTTAPTGVHTDQSLSTSPDRLRESETSEWHIDALAARLQQADEEKGIIGVLEWLETLRKQAVIIPVTGSSAEKVWEILLKHAEAIEHMSLPVRELRQHLLKYAVALQKTTGTRYHTLYSRLVGSTIKVARHRSPEPLRMHSALSHHEMCSQADIVALVSYALDSKRPLQAFNIWRAIYQATISKPGRDDILAAIEPTHSLYSRFERLPYESRADIVSVTQSSAAYHPAVTLEDAEIETAIIKQGGPAMPASRQQVRQDTPATYHRSQYTDRAEGSRYASRTRAPITRADMNTIVGDVHGITEKKFTDSFCARMLATRLSTPRMSITALRLLGIDKLGSLSVQEMARRAQDLTDFKELLEETHKQGMELVENNYTKLLQQLADCNDSATFTTILQSDQHPDNYDDLALQGKLVHQQCRERRWVEVQLGLRIIALGGRTDSHITWNASLQDSIMQKQLPKAEQILKEMRMNGIKVTLLTRMVAQSLLSTREASKQPVSHSSAPISQASALSFLIKLYRQSIDEGGYVSLAALIELIKRLGMSGKFKELHDFILWLHEMYRQSQSDVALHLPEYDKLFNTQMQAALVIWSWRAAGRAGKCTRDTCGRHEWADGLALLHKCYEMGLPVSCVAVKRAITQQLWLLFGPGHSARLSSDLFVSKNRIPIWSYIIYLEDVWPGITGLSKQLIDQAPVSRSAVLVALFGTNRKTQAAGTKSLDIQEWAERVQDNPRPLSDYNRYRRRQQHHSSQSTALLVDHSHLLRQ